VEAIGRDYRRQVAGGKKYEFNIYTVEEIQFLKG
jgi:hypothetical protein